MNRVKNNFKHYLKFDGFESESSNSGTLELYFQKQISLKYTLFISERFRLSSIVFAYLYG